LVRIVWRRQALADLAALQAYIAKDDPQPPSASRNKSSVQSKASPLCLVSVDPAGLRAPEN
jgi:hypothetical protein